MTDDEAHAALQKLGEFAYLIRWPGYPVRIPLDDTYSAEQLRAIVAILESVEPQDVATPQQESTK